MPKEPIMIDQLHIDINAIEKLDKDELKELSNAFKDTSWLVTFLGFQFQTKLRNKIRIRVSR